MRVELADVESAQQTAAALVARARKWPQFWRVERHILAIVKQHQDFRRGPIDALRLFKAYRLALAQDRARGSKPCG